MAIIVNFETSSNAAFVAPLQFVDTARAGINLTGVTLKMQARARPEAEEAALTLASGAGMTVTDPANGVLEIDFNVVAASLAAMLPGSYPHDCIATWPDGSKTRLFKGVILHDMGITR